MKPHFLRSLLLGSLFTALGAHGGDWPQWRGPARDGHAAGIAAPGSLPKDRAPSWKTPAGGGFSGPVVSGRTLVFLDENGSREIAHALDAVTGRELWQIDYADVFKDEWGAGPRATPIIEGDRVYVQSCSGEFRCLALKDGKVIWGTSYEKDFGVKFLGSKANEGTATRRGNNGSGVIDGKRIILPVGATRGASLVCFDKVTGNVLWKSGEDEAAYSSFMAGTLAGVRQVVAFTADALLGADIATGKILWRVPLKTNAKRHAASPVILGDRVVVNSHSIGLVCFEISKTGDAMKATQAWANTDLLINLATPVAVGGFLYTQGAHGDFVCVDAKNGAVKWSQAGFGGGKKDYASTIAVGDHLLVLSESGQLTLLGANPEKYTELGRIQVCGNTWSFPAYADGKIFVRDGRQLLCLDLAGK
ncbi:MAG: outer membrane protein assembly factor BamB [Verrucomicrobiota bacterium]|jgi:outer membrane protein assembly factor BamB